MWGLIQRRSLALFLKVFADGLGHAPSRPEIIVVEPNTSRWQALSFLRPSRLMVLNLSRMKWPYNETNVIARWTNRRWY